LQLTYLSFGKVGPLRTRTDVLAVGAGRGTARVTLTDDGAEARRMTSARVVATRTLNRADAAEVAPKAHRSEGAMS
jgi:hypothetical protein